MFTLIKKKCVRMQNLSIDEAILNVYTVVSEEKERFIMMNESM